MSHPFSIRLLLFLSVLLISATACDQLLPGVQPQASPSSAAVATAANAATAAAATAEPAAGVTPGPATLAGPPAAPTQTAPAAPLRVWIPPEIGAATQAGGQALTSQIRAFQPNGGAGIVIEQKPMDGPGGLLSYLQTGRGVAPSVMPDVVAVPTALLADPRLRDLFYPIDSLIAPAFIEDVYPAPAGQVSNGDRLLGYPFATTGLTHLVYDPGVITDTIPASWTQLISDTNHTLVFPADSREGAMLGLQFYLAEGGRTADESGRPILEAEPLARALATIAVNKPNLLQSHQLKTLDEAWQYHLLGLSNLLWMRADYLLGRQALEPGLIGAQGYSAVPGASVALIPLTTSWAWAITTPDPTRQETAAGLIEFLTTPDNLAEWSELNQTLPARRAAMTQLAEQNPYYQFAGIESERARAIPVSETSRLMDVLGDAVFQALTTDLPPALIAEQAAATLNQ
jgi:ABC-type glycerol-3-phosphate transport system substrate-binding protein